MNREKILDKIVRAILRKEIRLQDNWSRDLGRLASETGVSKKELHEVLAPMIRDEMEKLLDVSFDGE